MSRVSKKRSWPAGKQEDQTTALRSPRAPRRLSNREAAERARRAREKPPATPFEPFRTDGCSAFPDGIPGAPGLWRDCCVEHDFAYYKGGSKDERAAADEELGRCVGDASGSDMFGELMEAGVHVGGTPKLPLPWRWGYGQAYQAGDVFDGYDDLSPDEEADADKKLRAYKEKNADR